MKNIAYYHADKYCSGDYKMVDNCIYQVGDIFLTSLSFEQEPEFGECEVPGDISQFPLEDILHEFNVYISDFYDDQNMYGSNVCKLEFASNDIENIRKLRSIIGNHVYNKSEFVGPQEFIRLIIED